MAETWIKDRVSRVPVCNTWPFHESLHCLRFGIVSLYFQHLWCIWIATDLHIEQVPDKTMFCWRNIWMGHVTRKILETTERAWYNIGVPLMFPCSLSPIIGITGELGAHWPHTTCPSPHQGGPFYQEAANQHDSFLQLTYTVQIKDFCPWQHKHLMLMINGHVDNKTLEF